MEEEDRLLPPDTKPGKIVSLKFKKKEGWKMTALLFVMLIEII